MTTGDMIGLGGFVAACFVTASSGAVFKPGDWYESLAKPWWRPPNWAFPVVWSVLYIMIAVSGWMVWRVAGFDGAGLPLALYFVQLGLNAAWSGFFFGMKRMDLALVDVGLLWLSIAGLIVLFHPISSTAAYLLLPYLLWVSIASFLNYTMLRMNPKASLA
jgi:translocator protein